MECSSTTLWAEHRLAVRQNYSLTPKSRLPHLFLLISLISLPLYLFAVAPDNIWPAPLFSISLLLAMHVIALIFREMAATRQSCVSQNDPGRDWWSDYLADRGYVSMK